MSFLFPFKVNKAIAAIGLDPMRVPAEMRQKIQDWGKANALTAEETAFVIVARVAGMNAPPSMETAMQVWTREGKLNLEKPAVIEGLQGTIYG